VAVVDGWLQTENIAVSNYPGWYIPVGLTDLRSFLCAGYMHNSAYLGDAISVLVVRIFHFWCRTVTNRAI
jgi:hypothetical protein